MHDGSARGDIGGLAAPDLAVARALAPYRGSRLVGAVDRLGKAGDQPPLLALSGAVLAAGVLRGDIRLARGAAHVGLAIVIATGLKKAVKLLVARSRPKLLLEEGRHELGVLGQDAHDWNSMPSGHAAASAAAAQAATQCWPALRVPALAAAGALALARLPPGKHYLTDIAAGFALGMAAAWLAARILPPAPSRQEAARRA